MKDFNRPDLSGDTVWYDRLCVGDVALFRFPNSEPDSAEQPKTRTCLVVNVEHQDTQVFVEIAFGTSAQTDANRGLDIGVTEPDEMATAGLRKQTRFVCARRIIVSINHAGWDLNDQHDTPVVGRLGPQAMSDLAEIRERIAACQENFGHRWKQPKPFVVEHRSRRRISNPERSFKKPRSTGGRFHG